MILTGDAHDALPRLMQLGRVPLIAIGTFGKFISLLDPDVKGGRVAASRHALILVFSNTVAPNSEMTPLA